MYCYYAVMKLHWKPSEFAFLSQKERALMYAFIDQKCHDEDKQRHKIESKIKK